MKKINLSGIIVLFFLLIIANDLLSQKNKSNNDPFVCKALDKKSDPIPFPIYSISDLLIISDFSVSFFSEDTNLVLRMSLFEIKNNQLLPLLLSDGSQLLEVSGIPNAIRTDNGSFVNFPIRFSFFYPYSNICSKRSMDVALKFEILNNNNVVHRITYSPLKIAMPYGQCSNLNLSRYQNPEQKTLTNIGYSVDNEGILQVRFQLTKNNNISFELNDLSGRNIFSTAPIFYSKGLNVKKFVLSKVSSGFYQFKLNYNSEFQIIKVAF